MTAVNQRGDDLHLALPRIRTDDVRVALPEFTEASLLGAIRAPDRSDLEGLERLRELPAAAVTGIVAGQRHGQVEAQAQIGELLAGGPGLLELLAALEHLEDQLLVVASSLAQQHAEVSSAEVAMRLETKRSVDARDGIRACAPGRQRREKIAEPRGWGAGRLTWGAETSTSPARRGRRPGRA